MNEPIIYNGTNILTEISGWFTTGTTTYRYPARTVNIYDLPDSDKSAYTSSYANGRDVNISGVIRTNSRGSLDEAISKLYAMFASNDVTLELPVGGEQRYFYEVSVKNIVVADVAGGYAAVNIELHADDPYSYATTTTELLNVVNVTSGSRTWPVTVEGIGEQAPTITYTLDSYTDSTGVEVSIGNPDGEIITVRRTWAANDVLDVDCKNLTVKVNDEQVLYSGKIPTWRNGSRSVSVSDTFTERQFDLSVVYEKRYS